MAIIKPIKETIALMAQMNEPWGFHYIFKYWELFYFNSQKYHGIFGPVNSSWIM